MGKVSSFGPCPPRLSAAAPSPVVTPEPADACSEFHAAAGAAGAASLILGNVPGARGDAAGGEELPLMGCPDGVDGVCLNVSIPAVIIYLRDKLKLENWQRNAEEQDVILQATIYARPDPAMAPPLVIGLLATGILCGYIYVIYRGSI